MKKCSFLLPAIFFVASGFTQNIAQFISIKGIVTDSATLQPISYVTVILKDNKSGRSIRSVVTKTDGSFLIKAPLGNSFDLLLSFVGYSNKTVLINSSTSDID